MGGPGLSALRKESQVPAPRGYYHVHTWASGSRASALPRVLSCLSPIGAAFAEPRLVSHSWTPVKGGQKSGASTAPDAQAWGQMDTRETTTGVAKRYWEVSTQGVGRIRIWSWARGLCLLAVRKCLGPSEPWTPYVSNGDSSASSSRLRQEDPRGSASTVDCESWCLWEHCGGSSVLCKGQPRGLCRGGFAAPAPSVLWSPWPDPWPPSCRLHVREPCPSYHLAVLGEITWPWSCKPDVTM